MATKLGCFANKLIHRLRNSILLTHLTHFGRSTAYPMTCSFYKHLAGKVNSLFTHICYFLSLSFVGYCVLKSINTRPGRSSDVPPRSIDFFFTAVSTATDSSMSTVEMEVFSNSHLLFMTFLMFVGGEVFVSMVALMVKASRMRTTTKEAASLSSSSSSTPRHEHHDDLELSHVVTQYSSPDHHYHSSITTQSSSVDDDLTQILKYKSVHFLGVVVLCYLIVTHAVGISLLSLYLALESSGRDVLRRKGLKSITFSVFTVVSTFASCGFVPTNENMIVFRKNTVMLLILLPQVLLGNTLFPSCLRLSVWFVGKFWMKKSDYAEYLLRNTKEVGFYHLLPSRQSGYLAASVAGFVAVQLGLFCAMDWNSEGLTGMNPVEKLVGALFLTVNSRHSGETIVDLTTVSMAVLVVFVVMMYLPPYTSFLPTKAGGKEEEEEEEEEEEQEEIREEERINMVDSPAGEEIMRTRRRRGSHNTNNHYYKTKTNKVLENLIFSQLSFLVLFVVSICITERQSMKEDPLNFNVFNIVLEVISAYGNVGFSMGYSCKRQVNPSGNCEDKFYSFCGKWSDEGKIVLILVMLFGRLKKFNMNGGKAWKLV